MFTPKASIKSKFVSVIYYYVTNYLLLWGIWNWLKHNRKVHF